MRSMILDKNEKALLASLLKEHIDEVKSTVRIPNQDLLELAGEIKYEEFLEGILRKL
jgi:hypothetical protein